MLCLSKLMADTKDHTLYCIYDTMNDYKKLEKENI